MKRLAEHISETESVVAEKAVSQQQQKFMGMVHAIQKGKKIPGASLELKKTARTMKKSDVKDFAKTKHKGLPKKVDEVLAPTPNSDQVWISKNNKEFLLRKEEENKFSLYDKLGKLVKSWMAPNKYIPFYLEELGLRYSQLGTYALKDKNWPNIREQNMTVDNLNEVNPYNYDSDWDYDDAVRRAGKKRARDDEPPEPAPDPWDEHQRKQDRARSEYQKKVDVKYSRDEGQAPNGERYNSVMIVRAPEKYYFSNEVRIFNDLHWGAKKPVDQTIEENPDGGIIGKLYFVDNHKYGYFKPWKDEPPLVKSEGIDMKKTSAVLEGINSVETQLIKQDVAEVSLNEGQYEMMMRNGQVKKFIAKDDADAKRIAKGHGAKSVIKLKGGVPAGKVTEQSVAEGLPGSLSKSDYTSGKTVKHTSSNCTACHGRKTMYKLDGKLYADNKAGATKVKCPTCKGTGDKQGVAEGSSNQINEIDIDSLNQLASHAINTLGQGGANFAAGATGGLVGGAIAGGAKKGVDWYYKQKEKRALEKRKKLQQQGLLSDSKKDMAEGEMEESALQAYLGKKKYGKEGMNALQKAGREGASKETMAKIRAKHDKTDESISESRLLDESGHTLEHILNRFKHEVRNFQETGYLEDDLYDALFDYYMESGEMPYGVAKARTGDPIAWISGRLERHLGTNEALSGPKLAPDVDPLDIPAYKRVGGRHGGLANMEPSEPMKGPRPEDIPAFKRKAAGKDFPATLDQVYDTSDSISSLDTLRKMAGLPPRA